MFKVIIAGSRSFSDYALLSSACDRYLQNISDEIEIVSGGADTLGAQYARERGYAFKLFPANWDQHGKAAGYLRNQQMADYADALIAFWNGSSPGTRHMIETAKQCGLKIRARLVCQDH